MGIGGFVRYGHFFIIAGLFALISAGPAFAQAIPNFPAWKLDKIEKSGEQEGESVVLEYADYFALYPNDSRPPITIDGGTATRLLNGQANPETIYYNRTQGAAELAKQQAAGATGGGGNGAVGWQVAEATYVPMGEAKSGKATSSISTVVGAGGAGAGFAGVGGGAAGKGGSSSSASASDMIAAAQAAAAGGGARGGANGAGGQGSFSASGFLGNPSRGPTALPEPTADNGADANLTYSQMIEKATGAATVSACARMGGYAPAGACK